MSTKGEDTRSAVLGTALSLATQVGLEGVTIGKLAETVGMSKSGLFAHFSSKENLQIAVLDEAVARFVALAAEVRRDDETIGDARRDRLAGWYRVFLDVVREEEGGRRDKT